MGRGDTCMTVMLPPTRFATLLNVTDATVFELRRGVSAANTDMVICCDESSTESRYGIVATVMLPGAGSCAQSVKNTVDGRTCRRCR